MVEAAGGQLTGTRSTAVGVEFLSVASGVCV
uniref:Uncharacterized protein n=1 Tax=Arundo donax TaxID=35708 RepID=A0A0A9FBL1_ARUDO